MAPSLKQGRWQCLLNRTRCEQGMKAIYWQRTWQMESVCREWEPKEMQDTPTGKHIDAYTVATKPELEP